MEDFFRNGKIVNGLNPSIISLIPKRIAPQGIEDYRSISLIGGIYKILSKLLAGRLAKVMDAIISVNQSAFLAGQNIMDGIIVLNEALDEAKRYKILRFFFKVDFAKAYDSVNWKFLEEMMEGFQFNAKWRRWIKACVESASASVLVNGSPCGEFKLRKGLRQGDLISPFLYLMVAEGLSLLMQKAVDVGDFKPALIGRKKIVVSHLQYADDTVFVCHGDIENLKVIVRILRLFELLSGLKVNYNKSLLFGCNIDEQTMVEGAELIGCERDGSQFSYFGLKVGTHPHKAEN